MAGYQAVYGLEAVCRLKEGRPGVFDLSDAPEISREEIEKAGAELPELTEEEEKTGEQVKQETGSRAVLVTAVAASGIVPVSYTHLEESGTKICRAVRRH